jgi:hypothetical protein
MSFLYLFKPNEVQASIDRLNILLFENDKFHPITYNKDKVE